MAASVQGAQDGRTNQAISLALEKHWLEEGNHTEQPPNLSAPSLNDPAAPADLAMWLHPPPIDRAFSSVLQLQQSAKAQLARRQVAFRPLALLPRSRCHHLRTVGSCGARSDTALPEGTRRGAAGCNSLATAAAAAVASAATCRIHELASLPYRLQAGIPDATMRGLIAVIFLLLSAATPRLVAATAAAEAAAADAAADRALSQFASREHGFAALAPYFSALPAAEGAAAAGLEQVAEPINVSHQCAGMPLLRRRPLSTPSFLCERASASLIKHCDPLFVHDTLDAGGAVEEAVGALEGQVGVTRPPANPSFRRFCHAAQCSPVLTWSCRPGHPATLQVQSELPEPPGGCQAVRHLQSQRAANLLGQRRRDSTG